MNAMVTTRLVIVTALLSGTAEPAAAQYVDPDTCSVAEYSCQQARQDRSDKQAQDAKSEADDRAVRARLLSFPRLPDERNVLLGSWRLEDNALSTLLDPGKLSSGADAFIGELWGTMSSDPDKLICGAMIGDGITFESATYSIRSLDGSNYRGSIAYRSTQKQVIVAIPSAKMMAFKIEDQNRILLSGTCPLVRVGAQPTTAAAAMKATQPAASAAAPTAAGSKAREPIEPISRLGRGVQLHGQKEFQHALQQLLAAAQSDPYDPRVYVYLADTYGWLGMDAEAKQAAERAKQLDPNAFEILR